MRKIIDAKNGHEYSLIVNSELTLEKRVPVYICDENCSLKNIHNEFFKIKEDGYFILQVPVKIKKENKYWKQKMFRSKILVDVPKTKDLQSCSDDWVNNVFVCKHA